MVTHANCIGQQRDTVYHINEARTEFGGTRAFISGVQGKMSKNEGNMGTKPIWGDREQRK